MGVRSVQPARPALRRPRVPRPPGPPGALLYAGVALRREPTAYFARLAREYPRLAHLRLGREHVYVLNHPDLVQELFVTRGRDTRKGRTLERIRLLLGDGLLTSEGERHRVQRRLIQPALHGERIREYAQTMTTTAREQSARWRDGDHVDLAAELSALTMTVVGQALFGSDLRGETHRVAQSLGALLRGYQRRMLPGADLLLSIPTPGRARLFEAIERLDRVVRRLIEQRRAAPPGPDLLSALLAVMDDDTQVRDEVMTLLLAGHETTASALTWTFWLLDENPTAAGWLHEELDRELSGGGSGDPGGLSYADLDRLPRTRAVLAEAMRLCPPSWLLGRRTLVDLELDGWPLPAGSLCVTSQFALHRDPRFWTTPERFEPARWIGPGGRYDEAAPGQPRAAYLPFGLGARICVGLGFAWTEGVLVLATLAHRWAPRVRPGHEVARQAAVTLRPKGGLPVVLHDRQRDRDSSKY